MLIVYLIYDLIYLKIFLIIFLDLFIKYQLMIMNFRYLMQLFYLQLF